MTLRARIAQFVYISIIGAASAIGLATHTPWLIGLAVGLVLLWASAVMILIEPTRQHMSFLRISLTRNRVANDIRLAFEEGFKLGEQHDGSDHPLLAGSNAWKRSRTRREVTRWLCVDPSFTAGSWLTIERGDDLVDLVLLPGEATENREHGDA